MQRTLLLGLSFSVALAAAAAACRPQVPARLADLFSPSDGILLSVTIELPDGEITSEEAHAYCREKLAAVGVPVVEMSEEEGRGARIARLALSVGASTPFSSIPRSPPPPPPHKRSK